MNEYVFYYNENPVNRLPENATLEDIKKAEPPYIWYYHVSAENIIEAIQSFVIYGANEDQIIQVIVKNKLH